VPAVTHERETIFYTGKLLDPDDFSLEQEYLREKGRTIDLGIQENGHVERWTEVPSLAASGPDDRHFTLDRETGEVRFGDGEHGRRPASGSRIEAAYRSAPGRTGLLAIPIGAALAGFAAAFVRHRKP
jgi:hypothetical protein